MYVIVENWPYECNKPSLIIEHRRSPKQYNVICAKAYPVYLAKFGKKS